MPNAEEMLQLNEFFVEGGNQQKSHVLLHLTEPSTPEEKAKGYFFAVAEINNSEIKYIAKLQEYIDEIENGYYELADQEEKNSLELVLEKINQKSYSLIKPEIELHCVVGAIRQPEVILSFAGSPHSILFYKNKQGLYQQMNLVEQTDEPAQTERPQLFGQIIIGKISPDDFLFAATPHVTNYFSYDRLQKIITTRPARQSADHLERVLSELRDGISFGGLIIHVSKTLDGRRPPFKKAFAAAPINSVRSLDHLFNTEQQTANTLSVSLFPQISEKIKNIFKTREKTNSQNNLLTPAFSKPPIETNAEINAAHLRAHRPAPALTPSLNFAFTAKKTAISTAQIIILLVKYLIKTIWWLMLAAWHIVIGLLNLLGKLFIVTANWRGRRKYILEDWRRLWHSYKENFKQLPTATKLLLLGASTLIIVFIISLGYLKHQQTVNVRQKQLQNTISLINAKIETAQSLLSFNDETKALPELQNAATALQTLPCNASENKILCKKLSDSINSLTIKLRKITVSDPVLLTEWKGLTGQSDAGLLRLGAKIISLPASGSQIFTYDLLSKEQKNISTNNKNLTILFLAVPKENDYVLLGAAGNELFEFKPTDYSINKIDVSYPAKLVELKTAVIYNRRLYGLDTLNNQIYKHDSIKSGFGPGKPWLKDASANVKEGTNITIDGDLYVLNKNGSIIRITKGVLDSTFAVTGLDPTLTNAGKIWTYNDLQYLYVLDGAQKRLIILNKDGKLKAQITFAELISPSDFAVDEPNRVAYLVDGAKLYKIDLPR